MTAPRSVVQAVMEVLGCGANSNGFCNRHHSVWTGRGCRDAVEAADAAFAASLEWAADQLESNYPRDIWPEPVKDHMSSDRIGASMGRANASALRRWARDER